jgi:hypothetical protein
MEQWTNRNQELIQRTNKKQGGLPSYLAANSNEYNFSRMFSQGSKPEEVPFLDREVSIFVKIF